MYSCWLAYCLISSIILVLYLALEIFPFTSFTFCYVLKKMLTTKNPAKNAWSYKQINSIIPTLLLYFLRLICLVILIPLIYSTRIFQYLLLLSIFDQLSPWTMFRYFLLNSFHFNCNLLICYFQFLHLILKCLAFLLIFFYLLLLLLQLLIQLLNLYYPLRFFLRINLLFLLQHRQFIIDFFKMLLPFSCFRLSL